MADDELWQEVGRLLKQARLDKGWKTPAEAYANKAPHNNIVTDHENGVVKSIASLEKHASVLDSTVSELLRSALANSPEKLSLKARYVARQFDALLLDDDRRSLLKYLDSLAKKS